MNDLNKRPKSNRAQIILAICATLTLLVAFRNLLKDDINHNENLSSSTITDKQSIRNRGSVSSIEKSEEIHAFNDKELIESNIVSTGKIINLNNTVSKAINQILNDSMYNNAYEYLKENKHYDLAQLVLKSVKKKTIQQSIISKIKHKEFILDFIQKYNYDDVWYEPSQNTIITVKNEKYGFFDFAKRIEIVEPKFTDLDIFHEPIKMFKVGQDSLWGLINWEGKVIYECIFKDIIDEYHVIVINDNGKLGILNKRGEIISEPQYTNIKRVWINTFMIEKKGKWGLLDTLGNEKLKPKYELLETEFLESGEHVIKAIFDGKMKYLDLDGNEIVR